MLACVVSLFEYPTSSRCILSVLGLSCHSTACVTDLCITIEAIDSIDAVCPSYNSFLFGVSLRLVG